jgi:uncharacterized membrane protein YqjE
MSNQATMNGARANSSESAAGSVARSTGEFLHDLVTLGELQLRLVAVDGQEGLKRFLRPGAAILSGLALGLASLPVLLIALAIALMEIWKYTPAQAAGIAAGAGLLTGLLLIAVGYWGWRAASGGIFDRSQREWKQNVRWIKDALQRSGGTRPGNRSHGSAGCVKSF